MKDKVQEIVESKFNELKEAYDKSYGTLVDAVAVNCLAFSKRFGKMSP